jgi:hypothetical protein
VPPERLVHFIDDGTLRHLPRSKAEKLYESLGRAITDVSAYTTAASDGSAVQVHNGYVHTESILAFFIAREDNQSAVVQKVALLIGRLSWSARNTTMIVARCTVCVRHPDDDCAQLNRTRMNHRGMISELKLEFEVRSLRSLSLDTFQRDVSGAGPKVLRDLQTLIEHLPA